MSKLIICACPFPYIGGGERRSFETIKYIKNFLDCEINIVLPLNHIDFAISSDYFWKYIKKLEMYGVNLLEYCFKFYENNISKNKKLKLLDFNISDFLDNTFLIYRKIQIYNQYVKFLLKYFKSKNIIGIYSQHEYFDAVYTSYKLAKKLNKDLLILLQLEPFRNYKDFIKFYLNSNGISFRSLANLIPAFNSNILVKDIYSKIINYPKFRGFLSVSLAPILLSNLQSVPYKILNPANAFESELLTYRKKFEKEDYAIFFARFSPEKGIFELPLIWRIVTKKFPDIKLIVCGRLNERFLKKFNNLINKYNLENKIEIKGYVPRDELFEIVSKAKVFIYPSHSDAFPLVTLESLAVGTPVVVYDIPAIKYTYKFDAVKIVKEWDVKAMAEEVIKILKLGEDEYFELINDKKLLDFLKLHSSWENVAKAEAEELRKVFNLH